MKYISTRGINFFNFSEVALSGFMKDGGLGLPEFIPIVSHEVLDEWKNYSYESLCYKIFRYFIEENEFSDVELKELISDCYGTDFNPSVISFRKLHQLTKYDVNSASDDSIAVEDCYVAELWNGPTLAFKDIGCSLAAAVINRLLRRSGRRAIAVVSTSGDTGAAVIAAVQKCPSMHAVVLMPTHGRISRQQQLMMSTCQSPNVHCFGGDLPSHVFDDVMRRCFLLPEVADNQHFCFISLNSINWVRMLAQIPIYFYCYLQLASKVGDIVQLYVPVGGAGNIVAGYIAQQMGLPIGLVGCSNENDPFTALVERNDLTPFRNYCPHVTLAPAMDTPPYNLERLIYMLAKAAEAEQPDEEGGSHAKQPASNSDVVRIVDEALSGWRQRLPPAVHHKMRRAMQAQTVDDAQIESVIRHYGIEEQPPYAMCPHTATAVAVMRAAARRCPPAHSSRSAVVHCALSTASAAKFRELIAGRCQVRCFETPPALQLLEQLPERIRDIAPSEDPFEVVRHTIVQLVRDCSPCINQLAS